MQRWRMLMVLAVGMLGCVLGAWATPRYVAPWEPVAIPDPVTALLVYDGDSELVVRLQDGRVLGCNTLNVVQSCTEQPVPAQRGDTCGPPRSPAPPPPGTVQATLAFEMCGVDTTISQHFVLLTTGDVWQWEAFHSGPTTPYWLSGALLGGLVGLVAGALGSLMIVLD